MKRFHVFLFVLVLICSLLICSCAGADNKEDLYREANRLMSDSAYEDAAAKFSELGQYEDASLLAMYCRALNAAEHGYYSVAVGSFSTLGSFRDCELLSIYYTGLALETLEDYEGAQKQLIEIINFKDCNERIASYVEKTKERDYNASDRAEKAGDLESALKGFIKLGDYSDSVERVTVLKEKLKERDYKQAVDAESRGDYAAALDGFTGLGDYLDSKDRASALFNRGTYAKAEQKFKDENYAAAYSLFSKLDDYEDSKEKAYIVSVCQFAESINGIGDGVASFVFHDKTGFINIKTNKIVAPAWDSIDMFDKDGVAIVSVGKKKGVIDENGATVISCEWDEISSVSGLFKVGKKTDKKVLYGLYDKAGKMVSESKWLSISKFNGDLLKVEDMSALWGFINTKGETVGEIRWGGIDEFSEGAARVSDRIKFGFINEDGSVLIEPEYQDVRPFSEGLAAVKTKSGWGYIDKTNTFVIYPAFSEVHDFKKGIAEVYLKSRGWNIVDTKGNLLYFIDENMEAQYSEALELCSAQKYQEAYSILVSMPGYKDSNAKAEEIRSLLLTQEQIADDTDQDETVNGPATTEQAALLKEPSNKSERICVVQKNTPVIILEKTDDGFVYLELPDGTKGYMLKKYIKE